MKRAALLFITLLLSVYAWHIHTSSWSILQYRSSLCDSHEWSDITNGIACDNRAMQDYGEQQWLMWISGVMAVALLLYSFQKPNTKPASNVVESDKT